ncbi:hypothetical protein MBRA1_000547 [Malassezia brasiliensis]|uniref:Uncharacterized protein n=1 Tax=Malassezia brasiliensis TaxID=1821822 RepID=A0AAF0DQQ4_9BASI|nr:hypothetical protein MBRA1_000547 [Malassezia brasiliensis]
MARRGEPRAQRRSAFEHFDESSWLTGVRERLRTALWEHTEPLDTVTPASPSEHDNIPEDPHAKAHMQRASDAMQELLALGGIVDEERNMPVHVDGFADRVWRVDQPPEESRPSSLFSAFDRGAGVDIDALLQFRIQAAERDDARMNAPKPKPKPLIEELDSDARGNARRSEESSEDESESEGDESESDEEESESEGDESESDEEESQGSEESEESKESEEDGASNASQSASDQERDELIDDHEFDTSQTPPATSEAQVHSSVHSPPSHLKQSLYDAKEGEDNFEVEGYDGHEEDEYDEDADEDDLVPTSSRYDADESLHDSESMYGSASNPAMPSTDRFMVRPSVMLSKLTRAHTSDASQRGQEDSPIVVLSESEDEERADEAIPNEDPAEWSDVTQRSEESDDSPTKEVESDGADADADERSVSSQAASEDETDHPIEAQRAEDAVFQTGVADDVMQEKDDDASVPLTMQAEITGGTTTDAVAMEAEHDSSHPHDALDEAEHPARMEEDHVKVHHSMDDSTALDAIKEAAHEGPQKKTFEGASKAHAAVSHEANVEDHPSSLARFSQAAHDEAQQAGHSGNTFARELASEMGLDIPLSMPEASGVIAEDAWPSFAHALHSSAPLSAPLLLDDEGHPRLDMSSLLQDEYMESHGNDESQHVPLRYGSLLMDDREDHRAAREDEAVEAHTEDAPTEPTLGEHHASSPADADETTVDTAAEGDAAEKDNAEAAEEDADDVAEDVGVADAVNAPGVHAANAATPAKDNADAAPIESTAVPEGGPDQADDAVQPDAGAERRSDVEAKRTADRPRSTSPSAIQAEPDAAPSALPDDSAPKAAEASPASEIPQESDLSADQEVVPPKRGSVTTSQAHAAHTSRHTSDGPITRSQCVLQRVTLLRESGAPTFLVPSCALDAETLEEEGAEKQDLFTDQLEMIPFDPGALPESVYHALCRIVSPSLLDDVYVTPSSLGAQWMVQEKSDNESNSASLDNALDVPPTHAVRQTYSRRHRRPRKSDPSSDVANYVPPEAPPHRPSSPADVSIEELEALEEPSQKRTRTSASPPPRMQLRTARERRRTRRFSPS